MDNQPTPTLSGSVGSQLQNRREEAGLSISELSRQSGIHRSYISDIEAGRVNPTIGVLEVLAHYLYCTLSVTFNSRRSS